VQDLVVAGGVAANQRLREKLTAALPAHVRLHIPSPAFCTDNGAMIAALGSVRFLQGERIAGEDLFAVEVSPRTEAKKMRGKQ
jgi:N6-L-threonylcarbamoyladenine synthase